MKLITLFFVCITALLVSAIFGPVSDIPSIAIVNEAYMDTIYNQYLFSGFVTAVATFACAAWLRVSCVKAIATMAMCGALFVIIAQSSEPPALEHWPGILADYLLP